MAAHGLLIIARRRLRRRTAWRWPRRYVEAAQRGHLLILAIPCCSGPPPPPDAPQPRLLDEGDDPQALAAATFGPFRKLPLHRPPFRHRARRPITIGPLRFGLRRWRPGSRRFVASRVYSLTVMFSLTDGCCRMSMPALYHEIRRGWPSSDIAFTRAPFYLFIARRTASSSPRPSQHALLRAGRRRRAAGLRDELLALMGPFGVMVVLPWSAWWAMVGYYRMAGFEPLP